MTRPTVANNVPADRGRLLHCWNHAQRLVEQGHAIDVYAALTEMHKTVAEAGDETSAELITQTAEYVKVHDNPFLRTGEVEPVEALDRMGLNRPRETDMGAGL